MWALMVWHDGCMGIFPIIIKIIIQLWVGDFFQLCEVSWSDDHP
jgi:hypothetical protein